LLHQAELAEHNQRRLESVAAGGGDLRMEGDYAPKFREMLSELPSELGKLSVAYQGAGQALRVFASDLRTEKSRAATALRQGTDAATRYDGALREVRSLLPGGRELVVSPMLGVETSVEQATEGLDEGVRAQARAAAGRARTAEQDKASARRLADQAARLRGEAEGRAVEAINRALDHSGIKNRSWWQKAFDVVSWPFTSWDHFVSFCRGVALVVGVVALFVSGPIGWALVGAALVAGAVAFGDTLVKFTQGKASLADLALDALGLIPGSAGAIRLAGLTTRLATAGPRLLAMARNLPEAGRIVLGGLRDARFLTSRIPSSGFSHTAEAVLGAFRGAEHTPLSREVLDALDSGALRMHLSPGLNVAGTTRSASEIAVNSTMHMHDVLSTVVHEGRHALDISKGIIPSPGAASLGDHAFAELRAFSSASDFAKLNNLTHAEAFGLARLAPQELAINIAESYPHLKGITDGELMNALNRFLRS
jgi:hypothetical protein